MLLLLTDSMPQHSTHEIFTDVAATMAHDGLSSAINGRARDSTTICHGSNSDNNGTIITILVRMVGW